MTKLVLVLLSALSLVGCGDGFTAGEFSQSGVAGAVLSGGAAGAASAGQAGTGAAGAAQAGASTGGAPSASAGAAGMAQASGGAAPTEPPCAHAVDTVSPGYLALQLDTCYRTKESFDTLYCGGPGWASRTLRVNGVLVECNKTQPIAPSVDGYNYFEIEGPYTPSDWLRWTTSGSGMSCWGPWQKDQCADYQVGDAVSKNGHNYICGTAACKLCAMSADEPGGSSAAWLDEGACG